MSNHEYDSVALLTLPGVVEGSTPEKGLLSWYRPLLIANVRNQGVDVHVARGSKGFDVHNDTAMNLIRPEYDLIGGVSISALGERALSSYGVLRTITTPIEADALVPTLNPTSLRRMARDKSQMGTDILDPLGVYSRSKTIVRESRDLLSAFDAIPGSHVVIKPNGGMRSQNVYVGSKNDALENVLFSESDYIVEEMMYFSPQWNGIKGIDESNQKRLDIANRSGHNKELRIYTFGPNEWSAVARVADQDVKDFRNDDWLFIDPESIPEELVTKAKDILGLIKTKIHTDEVNIGIDYVYTTTHSDPNPRWRVMEINAAEPQLVKPSEHAHIGQEQYKKLADQIARIARGKI